LPSLLLVTVTNELQTDAQRVFPTLVGKLATS